MLDDFNKESNGHWSTLFDIQGVTTPTFDLVFRINVVTEGKVRDALYKNESSTLNEIFLLSIDLTTKQQTGCYYGLLFRIDDTNNYYWFQIRHGNKYMLKQYLNGESTELIEEKNLSTGIEVTSLAILGAGDVYKLYANNQPIDTFQSNAIKGNQAGIATTTCQYLETAEYVFDNFQIRSPNNYK